jgi:hypothetical protein
LTCSYSRRGFGRTARTAINNAIALAFNEVKVRFNAAELGSISVSKYPGFQIARVTLHARQIQKQASLSGSSRRNRPTEFRAHQFDLETCRRFWRNLKSGLHRFRSDASSSIAGRYRSQNKLYTEPGYPWKNGYFESFNSNCEISSSTENSYARSATACARRIDNCATLTSHWYNPSGNAEVASR